MVPFFDDAMLRILNADTSATRFDPDAQEYAAAVERIDPLHAVRLQSGRADLAARAVCTAALRELHVQLQEI